MTLPFVPLVISISDKDLLKYILSMYMLLVRFAKYAMFLAPFIVKGQALADFTKAYPCLDNQELSDYLPNDEVRLVETKW